MDTAYSERIITARFQEIARYFPVIILAGARQIGKTTFLKHILPDADYVVFDSTLDIENARKDPELFLKNHSTPLILDEIQYAPEVVSVLKRKIDQDRRSGQYFLTGSQQWGILKSMAESLAGRALFLDLESFCITELENSVGMKNWLELYLDNPVLFFSSEYKKISLSRTLYEQLVRGWFPLAQKIPLSLINDFYSSYIRTYIERDVRASANIEDYQLFGKFFRLSAALSAQEINNSHLGRDIGITTQTAQRWLHIMASTYQWFEVPPFTLNTVKRISGRAKGYIADTGIGCSSLAISTPAALSSHPSIGSIFETAVVNEIRKICSAMPVAPKFYHWRTHGGAEVDLLLERDGKLFPIEIKLKSNPQAKDCRGIQAFTETYPELNIQPGIILCMTERMFQVSEKVWAVPFA